MPDPSDEERELELQLECTREKNRRRKEEKRAEEEARRKAEEEKQKKEAAIWATNARKLEEEEEDSSSSSSAEPSGALTEVEVEIPHVVKKKKAPQRNKASGGDPDDGNEDDKERAPCERCFNKKIPCLEQVGKRSTVICKPCHDAKVKCSYLGRPVQVKRKGGPSSEQMAVMESQMAQLLADNRALREAALRSHQYLRQLLRRQDEDHP
ncbi:hypothetical protein EV359DRAFT_87146 [Lentinula novae-zelandiae]|nr:hypothetical protein EV359DRAFT_87146 [Lentinula novae-zelandiae]